MTEGIRREELEAKALTLLRQQPGCAGVTALSICTLPGRDTQDRNWKISWVALGVCARAEVDRGMIAVHYQLGQRFHVVAEEC